MLLRRYDTAQLTALPWKQIPVLSTDREHSHGRGATRRLKATEITAGIGFPGAVQVLQLTRKTRRRRGARLHTEVVYALTSLSAHDAHPNHIAAWLRGHWGIENKLHYVRDVTFDEDRSQNRTAGGPQVMATLRNLAISLLRLNEEPNIASARRHHARDPRRPTSDRTTLGQLKRDYAGALGRPLLQCSGEGVSDDLVASDIGMDVVG
jgi:predicted transposase YbfD/YdcC